MLLNCAAACVPTAVIAVKQTMMIKASITAYSTAVGPSSDFRKRFTFDAKFFIFPSQMCRCSRPCDRANENPYEQRIRFETGAGGESWKRIPQIGVGSSFTQLDCCMPRHHLCPRDWEVVRENSRRLSTHSATRLPRATRIASGPKLCAPALRPVSLFEDVRLHACGANRFGKNRIAPGETTENRCNSTLKPRSRSRLVKS